MRLTERLGWDSTDWAGFKSWLPATSIRLLFAMCQEVVLFLTPCNRGPVTSTPIVRIRSEIDTMTTLPIVAAIRVPVPATLRAFLSKLSAPDGINQSVLLWPILHSVRLDRNNRSN